MKLIGTMIVAATIAVMTAAAQTDKVDQRRESQQDRVAQGIKSGQLTAGETARWKPGKRPSTRKSTPTAR